MSGSMKPLLGMPRFGYGVTRFVTRLVVLSLGMYCLALIL